MNKKLHKPTITKIYIKHGHVHIIEQSKVLAHRSTHHEFASLAKIEENFGTDYRKECEQRLADPAFQGMLY